MSNKFIEIDRTQPIILPDKLEEWLDNNDLARFVVDVAPQLDTRILENAYSGGGSAPYPPKMMLALLFYGYAKEIFSSRQTGHIFVTTRAVHNQWFAPGSRQYQSVSEAFFV